MFSLRLIPEERDIKRRGCAPSGATPWGPSCSGPNISCFPDKPTGASRRLQSTGNVIVGNPNAAQQTLESNERQSAQMHQMREGLNEQHSAQTLAAAGTWKNCNMTMFVGADMISVKLVHNPAAKLLAIQKRRTQSDGECKHRRNNKNTP